jgi:hypothetical protein
MVALLTVVSLARHSGTTCIAIGAYLAKALQNVLLSFEHLKLRCYTKRPATALNMNVET